MTIAGRAPATFGPLHIAARHVRLDATMRSDRSPSKTFTAS
jgi:hypothetical protein